MNLLKNKEASCFFIFFFVLFIIRTINYMKKGGLVADLPVTNETINDEYKASDFFNINNENTVSSILPIDYFGKLIPDFYAIDTVERGLIEHGTSEEEERYYTNVSWRE